MRIWNSSSTGTNASRRLSFRGYVGYRGFGLSAFEAPEYTLESS